MKVGPFGSQLAGTDFQSEGYKIYNQRTVLDNDFDVSDSFISAEKYAEMIGFKLNPLEILITTRGSIGKVAIAPQNLDEGIIHPCIIKFAIDRSKVNNSFLVYIFNGTSITGEQLALASNATTIAVVYSEPLRNIKIPLPSIREQIEIVAYLDRRTAEIDSLLADLQSQAEMLDRYKRELIAETVIKGLEKSAMMKDSDVEWIGEIPAHWELHPLVAVAKENNVKNIGMICDNLLSLSHGRIIQKDIDTNFGLLPKSFEGYQIVQPGYTVLRLTDLQNDKRSLRTGYVGEMGIITSAYMGLVPASQLDGKYFNYLLHAYDLLKIYYGLGSGLRQTLKFSDMKRLPIPVPPMQEQEKISAFIDAKTEKINGLIADINSQIEKLKQYRQIVIHDAVTGKIKVSEGMGDGN